MSLCSFSLSPHSELPQNKIKKLGQELFALERLLAEFEKCVDHQKDQLKHLKVSWGPVDKMELY